MKQKILIGGVLFLLASASLVGVWQFLPTRSSTAHIVPQKKERNSQDGKQAISSTKPAPIEQKEESPVAPQATDVRETSAKARYNEFVKNHPYNKGKKLTREEWKAIPKYDRPDLAAQQEYFKTLDPHTLTVPSERLWEARRVTQEKLKRQRRDKAGLFGSWAERGPNNVGGRTRALMFDPNDATKKKVWAGGVAGGLWYNTDITGSNSWQRVNDFWSNMAISCIAYAPNATQTFYVGTGEGWGNVDAVRGGGIWKTTDGGTTWNVLNSTIPTNNADFRYVNKLVVNSAGHIFAGTRQSGATGGVYRSTDGGTSWTKIYSSSCADLELASNGDLYMGNFSGGVFRMSNPSTGASSDWVNIKPSSASGGSRVEIAIAPSTGASTGATTLYIIACSSSNNIAWFQKSTDGGSNWTSCTIPTYRNQDCSASTTHFTRGQAWYDLILAVAPDNADTVFAGGVDIHGSTDGGSSWAGLSYWTGGCGTYVHADIHALVFRPGANNEMITGTDGGVFYASNATGGNFEERNKDYNVTQFYACAMNGNSGSNTYLAGAQDNGTRRFSSAGIGAATQATGGDGAFCFIDQTNSNVWITSYVYNVYYRSTNGGTSFTTLSSNQSEGNFINPADYDNDENILYSGSNADGFKRITGIEGTPSSQTEVSVGLGGGEVTAIRADAYATGRIFIGTNFGGVYRIDGADGSSPTSTGLGDFSGSVSCVDIGANDNELIVTISSYGATSVYYTNDGGNTWTSKDDAAHGLPDMPIRWALFNPNDYKQVLLATELGVWSTSDITASNPGWEPTNTGLANVRCDMLQYRASDKQVAIATHGRGLFTSDIFAAPQFGIVSTSPAHNATSVAQNADLQITFSMNAVKGTGNLVIKKLSDNSTHEIIPTASAQVTINNAVVSIDVITPFAQGETYYVEIASGGFKSTTNLSYAGMSGSNTWKFTIFDNTPPTVSLSPANNATDVAQNANLVMTFNENVKKGTGNILIKKLSDNTTVETIAVTASNVTISNKVVTINPTNDFASFTEYYVEVPNTAITDMAGNAYAGLSGNAAWRFKTQVDVTAPQLVTLSPANNSVNFPGANNLVMTYNEDLQKGTSGNFTIKRLSDGSVVETIAVTSANVTVAGKVVTINPTNDLPYNVDLYVEMTGGSVRDLTGNSAAGIAGSGTWKFKTDFSTGVEDKLANGINIFPNPIAKRATLEVTNGISYSDVSLRILDVKGATAWEGKMATLSERTELDLATVPAGKYFLEIKTKQGTIIKPLIKQ